MKKILLVCLFLHAIAAYGEDMEFFLGENFVTGVNPVTEAGSVIYEKVKIKLNETFKEAELEFSGLIMKNEKAVKKGRPLTPSVLYCYIGEQRGEFTASSIDEAGIHGKLHLTFSEKLGNRNMIIEDFTIKSNGAIYGGKTEEPFYIRLFTRLALLKGAVLEGNKLSVKETGIELPKNMSWDSLILPGVEIDLATEEIRSGTGRAPVDLVAVWSGHTLFSEEYRLQPGGFMGPGIYLSGEVEDREENIKEYSDFNVYLNNADSLFFGDDKFEVPNFYGWKLTANKEAYDGFIRILHGVKIEIPGFDRPVFFNSFFLWKEQKFYRTKPEAQMREQDVNRWKMINTRFSFNEKGLHFSGTLVLSHLPGNNTITFSNRIILNPDGSFKEALTSQEVHFTVNDSDIVFKNIRFDGKILEVEEVTVNGGNKKRKWQGVTLLPGGSVKSNNKTINLLE